MSSGMSRAYFSFVPISDVRNDALTETVNGTVVHSAVDGAPAYRNPSKYRLSMPSGVIGIAALTFGQRVAIPSRNHADVAVRVRLISGNGNANGRVTLALGRGYEVQWNAGTHSWETANGGWGSISDQMAVMSMYGDGTIEVGHVTDGSFTALTSAAGPGSGARTASAGVWLRFYRSPLGVALYWGVGESDDACPKKWHCVLTSNDTDVLTASTDMRALRVGIETTAGITGGFVTDVLDAAWLGPSVAGMGTKVVADDPFEGYDGRAGAHHPTGLEA